MVWVREALIARVPKAGGQRTLHGGRRGGGLVQRTRHDNVDKTRQCSQTRQDKPEQDKTRQAKTRSHKTKPSPPHHAQHLLNGRFEWKAETKVRDLKKGRIKVGTYDIGRLRQEKSF